MVTNRPSSARPLEDSLACIDQFWSTNESWVIEGCYGDLVEHDCDRLNEMIFINLPLEKCDENARNRPWEPHEHSSKDAQDNNLEMLVNWIRDYGAT